MPECLAENSAREDQDVPMPLVSVCILSYNRPQQLDRVLSSIRFQTYKNLQIVVSDDCSPDRAVAEVIGRHARCDSRIDPHLQAFNLFYFKNMQFLLDRIGGEYVMWCDDDDWYEPSFIERCLEALCLNPAASTAFSYYREVDERGVRDRRYPDQYVPLERLTHPSKFRRITSFLFTKNNQGYCNIYYGLHRREILTWFRPEEHSLDVDMIVGMRIVSLGPLALAREHLFGKTVANKKEYSQQEATASSRSGPGQKLAAAVSILSNATRRISRYCRFMPAPEAAYIAALGPFWIVALFLDALACEMRKLRDRWMPGGEGGFGRLTPMFYDTRHSRVFSPFGLSVPLCELGVNVIRDDAHREIPVVESPHYFCAKECLANRDQIGALAATGRDSVITILQYVGLQHSLAYIAYVQHAHPEADAVQTFLDFIDLMRGLSDRSVRRSVSVLIQRRTREDGLRGWLLLDGLHRCAILMAMNEEYVSARVGFSQLTLRTPWWRF